ncbi:MAG: hypothetical protein KF847_20675 [Pirellulales bacterium]|nr:hypothetical protein [Pirellulales bacterium]
MTHPHHQLADALRDVTLAIQNAIATGQRSRAIDADDLVEVLLAIADRIDPPLAEPAHRVEPGEACPGCGERSSDRLLWQDDDETVRCARCGTTYRPGE